MLRVTGAAKTFGAGTPDAAAVLDGLDLCLERGEFVTVIGSNGAGKTTLFNAIAGSIFLDRGSIVLDGEDITWLPERRRARFIGRLFQDPHLGTAPGLSIEENLALVYAKGSGRFPLGLALGRKARSLFREMLSRLDMDLEKRLRTPAGTLSGGQRQALTLLLASLFPPKLLLLDEHTAALDPVAAKRVLALTAETASGAAPGLLPGSASPEPVTTLMITHNIRAALETGTRTIMMRQGKIVLDISGEERQSMTVEKILERYRGTVREELDTDRIILGTGEEG